MTISVAGITKAYERCASFIKSLLNFLRASVEYNSSSLFNSLFTSGTALFPVWSYLHLVTDDRKRLLDSLVCCV